MNRFYLYMENEDLGITPVENIFINHYLPKAPGDFVKVYLLGLKYCFNGSGNISNEIIAKTLDLLESDVVKAWDYWEEQGVIIQKSQENIICFLNIKEVVLNKSSFILDKKPSLAKKLVESRKDKNIKHMHEIIESMYGRPLSSIELSLFQEWIEEYSFSPELIVLLVEDCINRGRKEVAYLKQVALNWHDAGIKTPDQAESHMVNHREKWDRYFKVMSFLGFNRTPAQREKDLMDKWFDKFKFDLEIVLEACGKTTAISQPNFDYIDKILTSWHKKGFITLEQVRAEDPPANKKYFNRKARNKTSPRLDLDHNYDMENIEKKLLNRNRSDIGG